MPTADFKMFKIQLDVPERTLRTTEERGTEERGTKNVAGGK